jgi:ubiquinone/menaquinone biosynthesis C-methylase UbiE
VEEIPPTTDPSGFDPSGFDPSGFDPYGFDPFAQHPFYARINHALVQRALACLDAARPTGERLHIVDLASGTGAVTQLIVAEVARLGRPATVLGVEPSHAALQLARQRLQGQGVQFIHGDTQQLGRLGRDADLVCLCNAIHLMAEKAETVDTIVSALAPGGYFACNTTFFTGAQTPEGERFAHRWIRQAVGWLRRRHPELHPSHRGPEAPLAWLSADEYVELLETRGLQVLDQTLELANLPVQAVRDIGRYRLFIAGALPGIPVPIGAEALAWAAGEAARDLDVTQVPRRWLQLLAQRQAR